jgi:hypothetical protein
VRVLPKMRTFGCMSRVSDFVNTRRGPIRR